MSDTTKQCEWLVRRGGPSSGGGYDALNRTRLESCLRPAKFGSGYPLCTRHYNLKQKQLEQLEKRWAVKYGSADRAEEVGRG